MAKALDPATAYADQVVRGKVPSGQLVHLACERHLRDLKAGRQRGLLWKPGVAERAIRFFGGLRHSKGEWAGRAFELAPWQQFLVGSLFGWKKADGLRRFRTCYDEVARKNGKALALDTLIPTLSGWTTMGEIARGKTVFDERGMPCRVVAVSDVMVGHPCFEVEFSDGCRIGPCAMSRKGQTVGERLAVPEAEGGRSG